MLSDDVAIIIYADVAYIGILSISTIRAPDGIHSWH